MKRWAPLFFVGAVLAPTFAYAEEHDAARPISRVSGIVAGGASYGSLFGLELGAGTLEGGVTITQSPLFGITLSADARIGKTLTGTLAFGDIAAAVTFDCTRGRFRLGIGPQLSYFWVGRARDSDSERVDTWTVGVRSRVSVDLVYFDDDESKSGSRRGIYVELAPRLEKFLGPSGFAWHAGAALGVRF